PAVSLNVTKNGTNRLLVTVTARPGDTLQRIDWTLPANATAETTGGVQLPTGVTPPSGATSTTFVLRRTSGTAVTLPIVVRGSFGQWATFVGGGPDAWGP